MPALSISGGATNEASATVSITGNYASGQDNLAFTSAYGITGSFNATTGVLTLTGNASTANWQSVLQSVTYVNSSSTPNTATRVVSFQLTDANGAISNAQTMSIAVAQAPVAGTVSSTVITGLPCVVNPLSGDSDPQGLPLSITGIVDTANGNTLYALSGAGSSVTLSSGTVITLRTDGCLNVTASANGSQTFAAVISDGVAKTNQTINLTSASDQATAGSSTVTGTSTSLSVLGADSDGGGESNLTYTWSETGGPSGATFAANGSNAAKNTTVTFTQAGNYTFLATITDKGGLSTTSRSTSPSARRLRASPSTPGRRRWQRTRSIRSARPPSINSANQWQPSRR